MIIVHKKDVIFTCMRTAMATILSLLHSANASEKLANKSELYPYICSCKLK